jgi:uncharacterized membrane protein YbhN (UPF0104 family)
LAAVTTLANQLPVSGGFITKGLYLKHKYHVSYTKYFSSVLAIYFCTLATYGLLGMAILLYWVLLDSNRVAPILFVGFGAMAASLLVFTVPLEHMRLPPALRKWVQQAVEGWVLISKNPLLVSKVLVLQTLTMLIVAIRYWLAFHMLSQNVTASQVILMSSASILTQLVSFAPGGLGVREAIVGGVAAALGFDLTASVAAIGLDRLVATISIIVVGWISTIVLGNRYAATAMKPSGPEARSN